MIVKADFHAHTNADPLDILDYSPEQYIDWAAKEGYQVIAITHHLKITYTKSLIAYAKKRGILLIPGFEADIEGQHVVILNSTTSEISTWDDLRKERKKGQCFTILAHPFWSFKNIRAKKLENYAKLFDAVELCWLNPKFLTLPNRLAREYASRHKKVLVATGDIHNLKWAGTSFSEIDVNELTITNVLDSMRKGKVVPVQKFTKTSLFLYLALRQIFTFGAIYHRGQLVGRLIEKCRKRKN